MIGVTAAAGLSALGVTLYAALWSSAKDVEAPPAAKPELSSTPAVGDLPLGSPMTWPKGTSPRLVWTGFQMTGDGSRLFLQTTSDVELQVRPGKDGLTVTLQNCRIHMRNNGRPLDTSFFRTPVKGVAVHQRRKDIEVAIALREGADSTPRKQAGPNGSQFWILDFPALKSPGP